MCFSHSRSTYAVPQEIQEAVEDVDKLADSLVGFLNSTRLPIYKQVQLAECITGIRMAAERIVIYMSDNTRS
jgi:hypothetical protein